MKTIKEYLEELPEPYRTQAIANTPKLALTVKTTCKMYAITGAFVWSDSPEGLNYWEALSISLI